MPRGPQIPVQSLWIKNRFDSIDEALSDLKREHLVIFQKLDALYMIIMGSPGGQLTPELERAVKQASTLTKMIDAKVPDRKKG